jgi:hypothetical protein
LERAILRQQEKACERAVAGFEIGLPDRIKAGNMCDVSNTGHHKFRWRGEKGEEFAYD